MSDKTANNKTAEEILKECPFLTGKIDNEDNGYNDTHFLIICMKQFAEQEARKAFEAGWEARAAYNRKNLVESLNYYITENPIK